MTLEDAHLVEADRHIAELEGRIEDQQARLARLRSIHGSTEEAEGLLETLLQILALARRHRGQILDAIASDRV